jgi:hypothetical protein
MTNRKPVPDTKLDCPEAIKARLISIQNQRARECEKGPRRKPNGEMRPEWQDLHIEKLQKLDARWDKLRAKLSKLELN